MAVISQYPQVNSFIYLWLKQVKEPFTIWLFNIAVENLLYLRAAAPAADPGRIGKEAKQIGIKTLRCFAP
jgi:hypothetical protein